MSSKPGNTLEDYLAWQLNVSVEHQGQAPVSLGISTTCSHVSPRRRMSWQQFQYIVVSCEPVRPVIEDLLADYDEGTHGPWHEYALTFEDHYDERVEGWLRTHLKAISLH